MKRIAVLLGLAIVLSSVVILGSFITTDRTRYNNNFVRIFPPHAADASTSFKLDGKRFSLAGSTDRRIYLRDRSSRGGLLSMNVNMTDTAWMPLNIPKDSEIRIDSPNFFIQNGYTGLLQSGSISDWSIDTTSAHLTGFTTAQFISPTTAILRIIDLDKRKNLLVKSNSLDSPKDILKKQVDGILCTDGYLNYSKEYHRLIYTYRYRNQFLGLDTNLNVRLRGKTIDTTSVARISVTELDGKITMSKPPFVVNKGMCVDGKYLFVHSNLVAKNEPVESSTDRSVIDVYDILDGSYRFSFHIDNIDGSGMKTFMVSNNKLLAAFPKYIVRYDIPEKYLRE